MVGWRMAKVRVRPETGNLYLDFQWRGVRCREQTLLPDNAQNRKTLDSLATRIKRDISRGNFEYGTYFPNSSRAKAFEVSPQANAALQAPAKDANATVVRFAEAAEDWFAENEPRWRSTNATSTRSILDQRLLPAFGDAPVALITRAELLAFRAQTMKATSRKEQEALSASRVNHIMGVARMVLADAADKHGFVSPYRNIKQLRAKKVDIQPFSLDEVQRLLDTVRTDYRPYLTLRFYTGLRSGEANALEWQHIDFDNDVIRVRQQVVKGEIIPTKTDGSNRDVAMIPLVRQALLTQRENTPSDSRWVFTAPEGGPLNLVNFTNRVWHPLLRHLGLIARRPYQTRHTAATLMLAAGENPEWVAYMLGHTTTEMLFRVYSRYIPNLTRKDGRAFNGLVHGAHGLNMQGKGEMPVSLSVLSRSELEALVLRYASQEVANDAE